MAYAVAFVVLWAIVSLVLGRRHVPVWVAAAIGFSGAVVGTSSLLLCFPSG